MPHLVLVHARAWTSVELTCRGRPTIRKLYKLDAAPGSGKGGPAKTVNGAGHAGLTDAERKEAEVNIMGLIALKGS